MRVNQFQSPAAVTLNYGYYSDSRLYQVIAPNNHLYDRYFDYNNPIGSMDYTSANGDTTANQYYLTMSHDYLGNQTSRGGRYWWMATGTTFSNSTQFMNNKIISGSDSGSVTTSFDNEGNTVGIVQGSTQTLGPDKDDVAGRIVAEVDPAISKYYDGDGNLVRNYNEYYLFSKVLGGKQLSIISATGTKTETSVFGNGQLLARQEVIAGAGQVTFVHRDPNNTIDFTSSETKWVDVQGTTGKAATSTYISQYQAGMYGHPDPSFYAASSGQFYPGGGGNQKPGQSTVCTEDYVKVDCNSLAMDARNGGLKSITVYQQGLNGYDEDSAKFVASARAAEGASSNGRRTLIKRTVLPGTKTGIYIDGVLDESPDLEPLVKIEYIAIVSADPMMIDSIKLKPAMKMLGMDRPLSQPCQDALAALGQKAISVERAGDMYDLLENIGKEFGVPASLLAAAAIRETTFTNAIQGGGKWGRGYMQIDLKQQGFKVTEAQALDPTFNFTFGAKNLRGVYDQARAKGFSETVSWGAALHAHNSGGSWGDHLAGATDSDLSPLDVGTIKRTKLVDGKKTKVADYVTTVWAIKSSCF